MYTRKLLAQSALITAIICANAWAMTPAQNAKNAVGPVNPISWNMLTMQPSAVGQGTWLPYQSGSMLFGGCFFSGGNNGDNFSIDVVVSKGTYRFDFNFSRHTDRGIARLLVDGTSIGTVDMYGASDALTVGTIAGITLCGSHRLTFKIDGKNASSTGYVVNINAMQLLRTGD